jgi:hypothetical protein
VNRLKPTPREIEDYNAIPAPRCPKCGGPLWFDYETRDAATGHTNELQLRCKKRHHNVWMLISQYNEV